METLTWEMMLCFQHQTTTQRQQQGRQKGACWYIDMEHDVVDTAPDPCCIPFVRTPWSYQLGHAVDSYGPCLFECFSKLCLTAFAWLSGVLALLLSWPALAREWQPLWQIL